MSRKLTRLVLAATLAAGFGLSPMLAADAATSGIDVENQAFGSGTLDVLKGDTVRWYFKEGPHNVTPDTAPAGSAKWPKGASEDLEANQTYEVTFDKGGKYYYFCSIHKAEGMTGFIDVKDQTPPPPPPPPPPSSSTSSSTTTTTAHVVPGATTTTTSAPASSAGAKPLTPAPAPTTTTAKDKKGKDDKKEDETTTTTLPPPPPPVDLPDSAIIPVLPSQTGTTTQNGIEAPGDTPEGDAIALLKSKKGGGDKAMKLLIVSGLGLGALGLGTAGYKYANRSSKYFPA